MAAVINPSISTHRVPEGIASPQFLNQHFAMPVTPNRTVSFGSNVEIFEVPIEHDCNLSPCHAKHRTHNPVRIRKDDRTRKDAIEAQKVMPYLLRKCCSQLSFGSCMENIANATLHVTVISAVAIASVPT